jgi:hypothetical protein
MKWKRRVLRALLAFVILFDVLLLMQFHRHGWPAIINGYDLGGGRMQISVTRMPITAADWLLGALLVGVQGLVVYGNLRVK